MSSTTYPPPKTSSYQGKISLCYAMYHDTIYVLYRKLTCFFFIKRQSTIHPTIQFKGNPIQNVKSHKHLEIMIMLNNGYWEKHIEMILAMKSSRLNIRRKNKFILDWRTLEILYFSNISILKTLISFGTTFPLN